MVPGIVHDHPVERRHRDDHAERRALRQDRGGHGALLIREPLVDRVGRDRSRRSFTDAEQDAADQQRCEPDVAQHWKLHDGPDHAEHEQDPFRRHAIRDDADDDRRDGIEREERRAEQPELFRRKAHVLHDRDAGQTHDDLVGEIHEHVEEQQGRHSPCALGRRRCCHLVPRSLLALRCCRRPVSESDAWDAAARSQELQLGFRQSCIHLCKFAYLRPQPVAIRGPLGHLAGSPNRGLESEPISEILRSSLEAGARPAAADSRFSEHERLPISAPAPAT